MKLLTSFKKNSMRNLIFLGFLILLIGCVKSNSDLTTPLTPVVTIPNAPTNLKGGSK